MTAVGRAASVLAASPIFFFNEAATTEIYTAFAGVYRGDPRIVADARRIETISPDEMLELAACGAKVLQSRSVEMARRHGVRLHVRSSFGDAPGTWVREDGDRMEGVMISGAALDTDEAKVTIDDVPDRPGVAADMFDVLAGEGINIEMISTSPIRISCVIRKDLAERALRAVHERFGLAGGDGS